MHTMRRVVILIALALALPTVALADETVQSWTQAAPAVFAPGVHSTFPMGVVSSVSCASAGNCTAVGSFIDSAVNSHAFTATSTGGVWAQSLAPVFAEGVSSKMPDSTLNSVSCSSAGNCTAAGSFRNASDDYVAFIVTSTNGTWGQATPAVFGTGVQHTRPSSYFNSVACASPGNCTAVGGFRSASDDYEAFTMTAANGTWGQATPAVFAGGVQNPYPDAYFSSVSCASAGNCTAVGRFRSAAGSNTYEGFTMTSNNGTWEQAKRAVFADGVQLALPDSFLISVSCATAGNCTAVGRFKRTSGDFEAFTIASTNGTWGQAEPAVFDVGVENSTRLTTLTSVSCASAGNCTAVGVFSNSNDDREAFTMTSTNGTWANARPAQFPAGSQSDTPLASFSSVSCSSPGTCVAVGRYLNKIGGFEAITMTSVSGTWSSASPTQFDAGIQSSSPYADLSSVSCPSDGDCVIGGWFANTTSETEGFMVTLTSGVWGKATRLTSPANALGLTRYAEVNSVSCASSGNCTAVGSIRTTKGYEAFTVSSVNGTWGQGTLAVFAAGVQNDSPYASLESVSCATSGGCTAVGRFKNPTGNYEAFTMTSSGGTWSQARPTVFADGVENTSQNATFFSVSCASAGNCTAVGRFRSTAGPYTYEAFSTTSTNGTWSQAAPAVFAAGVQNPSPFSSFLDVSCASPGNCTAAGQFTNGDGFAESFTMSSANGTWSQARPAVFPPSVQSSEPSAYFSAVSCATAGNCTAAGTFTTLAGTSAAFTMTSTNGVWGLATRAVLTSELQSASPELLMSSVSCASPGNCTAVGRVITKSAGSEVFTMTSINGVWGEGSLPSFAAGAQHAVRDHSFNSVSCASAGNCTAVGRFRNAAGGFEAFTVTSINNVWNQVKPVVFATGIQRGAVDSYLSSVSCTSVGTCTAVGGYTNLSSGVEGFTTSSSVTVIPTAESPSTTTTPPQTTTTTIPAKASLLPSSAGKEISLSKKPAKTIATDAALATSGSKITLALLAPAVSKTAKDPLAKYTLTLRPKTKGSKTVTKTATVKAGKVNLLALTGSKKSTYQVVITAKTKKGKALTWTGPTVKTG